MSAEHDYAPVQFNRALANRIAPNSGFVAFEALLPWN